MKKLVLALCLGVASFGLVVTDAEAKRLGGAKSFGMQRQAVPTKPAAAPTSAPAGAAAPASRGGFLGPIAGLAAGLGIAALMTSMGFGEELANFVMIALLVFGAMFLFRMLFGRKAPQQAQPMRYAADGPNAGSPAFPQANQLAGGAAGAQAEVVACNVPADFDEAGFLRVAKLNFVRLQAANDAKNLEDIREFVSPELYAEVAMQMEERGDAPQQTSVVTLNAELLEAVTEGQRHIASVRFNGTLRETADGLPEAFDEVWHLTKPVKGDLGWTIAGIQQVA